MINRSYLFVPGNRPDRFDKARVSGADVTILDLEDAVTEEDKVTARKNVSDWLSSDSSDCPVYVRINSLSTSWFDADLTAVARAGLTGVLLPKAERPSDIEAVASQFTSGVSIVPIIETALSLWNVGEVAASSQVERIAFGSLDLQLDLGIEYGSDELLYARSRLVCSGMIDSRQCSSSGILAVLALRSGRTAVNVRRLLRVEEEKQPCALVRRGPPDTAGSDQLRPY